MLQETTELMQRAHLGEVVHKVIGEIVVIQIFRFAIDFLINAKR